MARVALFPLFPCFHLEKWLLEEVGKGSKSEVRGFPLIYFFLGTRIVLVLRTYLLSLIEMAGQFAWEGLSSTNTR